MSRKFFYGASLRPCTAAIFQRYFVLFILRELLCQFSTQSEQKRKI